MLCYCCVLGFLLFLWQSSPRNPSNRDAARSSPTFFPLPKNPTLAEALRYLLRAAGFCESFTFVCLLVILVEGIAVLNWESGPRGEARLLMWRLLVAYVSANHFLYLAHTACRSGALGNECPAGIGAWMVHNRAWAVHVVLFGEHRLADEVVHAGLCMALPVGAEAALHWYSLASHLLRYGGADGVVARKVPVLRGELSVDDLVDCVAHAVSGVRLLGTREFVVATLLWEAIRRWVFGKPLVIHHVLSCPPESAHAAAM